MDQIESAQQYSSAAELGDVNAQFTLALMYANGLGGLTKDYIYAHKWATMAAMNGNTEAAMLAELLAEQMTRQDTESSRKLKGNKQIYSELRRRWYLKRRIRILGKYRYNQNYNRKKKIINTVTAIF